MPENPRKKWPQLIQRAFRRNTFNEDLRASEQVPSKPRIHSMNTKKARLAVSLAYTQIEIVDDHAAQPLRRHHVWWLTRHKWATCGLNGTGNGHFPIYFLFATFWTIVCVCVSFCVEPCSEPHTQALFFWAVVFYLL